MEKMIVLHPDETVSLADYNGYETIRDAVDGNIEHFFVTDMSIGPLSHLGVISVDFYCNEEFLIRNDKKFDKINAVASLISRQEIRGDVAVLVNAGNGENRGFDYKEYSEDGCEPEQDICECWFVEDAFCRLVNTHREDLKELHEQFDNNKSQPHIEFELG